MTKQLVPYHWYVHTCGNCGVPIRRYRQHTNAAWYKRHGLEPKAFPITWYDASASQDCDSPYARTWRREQGWREIMHNRIDARHYALDHGTSEKEVVS